MQGHPRVKVVDSDVGFGQDLLLGGHNFWLECAFWLKFYRQLHEELFGLLVKLFSIGGHFNISLRVWNIILTFEFGFLCFFQFFYKVVFVVNPKSYFWFCWLVGNSSCFSWGLFLGKIGIRRMSFKMYQKWKNPFFPKICQMW